MVGFPVLKEESSDIGGLEVRGISRRLLSSSKKSRRPKLSNFYNDSDSMRFYKYQIFI